MSPEEFYNFMFSVTGASYSPWSSLSLEQQNHFRDLFDTWQLGDIAEIDDRSIKKVTVEVSNALMLTLRATPQVIIPAVVNRIIVPTVVIASVPQVTTARTGAVNVQLRYQTAATTFASITGNLDITTMQGATANARSAIAVPAALANAFALSTLVNKPLVVHNVDGSEYGAGHASNIVTFIVGYYLIEV